MPYRKFLKNKNESEDEKISSSGASEFFEESIQDVEVEELYGEDAVFEDKKEESEECGNNAFLSLGGKLKLNEEIEKAEKQEEERQRRKKEEIKTKNNLIEKRELQKKEIERSKEVNKQKCFWRNLVELRIHFQKCCDKFNTFPISAAIGCLPDFTLERNNEKIDGDKEFEKSAKIQESWLRLRKTLTDVLRNLLSLHYQLNETILQNSENAFLDTFNEETSSTAEEDELEQETNIIFSRRRKWQDISTEDEKEAWKKMNVWTGALKKKCFDVADQWKMKTQLEVFKGFKVLDQSPSAQFRNSLRDFPRFLIKARNPKNAENVIGYDLLEKLAKKNNEKCVLNVFEALNELITSQTFVDKEFYVDLLKSLIEEEAYNVDDVLTSTNEQKRLKEEFRKSSNKKKDVNRRASKGRVIRYVSIPQLLNFTSARGFESTNELDVIPGISDANFVTKLMNSLFASH